MAGEDRYYARGGATVVGQSAPDPASFRSGLGEGFETLGEAALRFDLEAKATDEKIAQSKFNVEQEAVRRARSLNLTDRLGAFADWQVQREQSLADLRQHSKPGADGHDEASAKLIDEGGAALLGTIDDPEVRARIAPMLANDAARAKVGEADWARDKRAQWESANAKKLVSQLSINVFRDPSTFWDAIDSIDLMVSGLDADGTDRAIMAQDFKGDPTKSMLDGMIARGENEQVIKVLTEVPEGKKQGVLDTFLTPEATDIYLRKARNGQAVQQEQIVTQQKEEEATLLGRVSRGEEVDSAQLRAGAQRRRARGDTSGADEMDAAAAANEETLVYGNGRSTPAVIGARMEAIEKQPNWRRNSDLVARHTQLGKLRDQERRAEPTWGPLDFANPAQVAARVSEARQWASTHNGELHILSKDQAAELANLAAGGPGGRAQVAGALATLPGPAALAAARQVAPNDYAMQQAIDMPGPLRVQMFEGEAALAGKGVTLPDKEIRERWAERGLQALGPTDEATRQRMFTAARNLYAYRAKGKAEFDEALWDRTLNEVLDPSGKGGIGEWGSHPLLLPDGMGQREFNTRIYSMPQNTGLFRADGKTPISRDELFSQFTPVPMAQDGLYRWRDGNGRYAMIRGGGGIAGINVRQFNPTPKAAPATPQGPARGPVYIGAIPKAPVPGPVYIGPLPAAKH